MISMIISFTINSAVSSYCFWSSLLMALSQTELRFVNSHVHTHTQTKAHRYKIYTHTQTHKHTFQAAVVSILLYGCTTWTLTKRLKKKLDGNYTRMLRAILNKSWRQHPTRHHTSWTGRTLLEKQGRAHKWCTPMDPSIWPSKSRATSSNIHTAAMWGHGM